MVQVTRRTESGGRAARLPRTRIWDTLLDVEAPRYAERQCSCGPRRWRTAGVSQRETRTAAGGRAPQQPREGLRLEGCDVWSDGCRAVGSCGASMRLNAPRTASLVGCGVTCRQGAPDADVKRAHGTTPIVHPPAHRSRPIPLRTPHTAHRTPHTSRPPRPALPCAACRDIARRRCSPFASLAPPRRPAPPPCPRRTLPSSV